MMAYCTERGGRCAPLVEHVVGRSRRRRSWRRRTAPRATPTSANQPTSRPPGIAAARRRPSASSSLTRGIEPRRRVRRRRHESPGAPGYHRRAWLLRLAGRPPRARAPLDPFRPRRRRRRRRSALLPLAVLLRVCWSLPAWPPAEASTRSRAGCDFSTSCRPRASGRTRSSMPRTARCSARSRRSRTGRWCRLAQISPWVPKATIAIEDRRFFDHGGVDPEGIVRALWADLRAGQVVQGGSTITQQLVRNLTTSREQTVVRKVNEACLAVKLERAWSKPRILASYLNHVFYGSQAYGIEAASQTYFSKPARSLNLRAGGDARRSHAGAVRLRPGRRAREGDRAAGRGAQGDARGRDDHPGAARLGSIGAHAGAATREPVPGDQGAVLLRLRPRRADPCLRRRDRALRRAARLHDDRAPLAEARAAEPSPACSRSATTRPQR